MNLAVYLLSRSQLDVETVLSFLRNQGTGWNRNPGATEAEELVEVAGRVCYMSFGQHESPRTNRVYIQHLLSMEHESVLEHASWTFLLSGVSRAFSHQLVRHRVGFAFNQLLQQYHDETDAEFVELSLLLQFPKAREAWQRAVQATKEAYQDIVNSI